MIKKQKTKTLITKPNNNSANCIAPNIIYGCFGGCVNTYCYMARYNGKRVFVNQNVDEIFQSVVEWEKSFNKEPDQQDPIYTMVDVACNSDLVLMQKHMPEPLIDYLKRYDDHPQLNSTMATKYPGLLKLDVNHFNKPPRVRVSLMPQKYSNILEPKMQAIDSRINKCEVIALTNHRNQMAKASPKAQELMRRSYELKNKSGVMRYPLIHKTRLLREFKEIYSIYFPLNTIRYIF